MSKIVFPPDFSPAGKDLSRIWPAGGCFLALLMYASTPGNAKAASPVNLALSARASAFESQDNLTPKQANDGKISTRWSGIPGDEKGGWFELDWDQPVRMSEVVVLQYDRFVGEMDAQVWDDAGQTWVTVEHLGLPGQKLPKVVECHFDAKTTKKLRLANITGGPSFSEVEVFEHSFVAPPEVNLASDVNGHFIGLVSDGWVTVPLEGVEVSLSGQAQGGAWKASARTDGHGLFVAPMPLGLSGKVAATLRTSATEGQPVETTQFDAEGFQYGLTPQSFHRAQTSLDGEWKFAPDPPADFWKAGFDDSRWAGIRVPAHFELEGFRSEDGLGGYRTRFPLPSGGGRLKLRFEGVYSGADVWVNGQRVAYHEGGALPFEVDVTGVAHAGENVLAVRVAEHTAVSDQLDKMSEYADFHLAGIMRPVYLFRTPETHIGALQVSTTFDSSYRDATVSATVAALNESGQLQAEDAMELRLLDANGGRVAAQAKPLAVRLQPWGRTEVTFSVPVAAPKHWEAEHPNLYRLEVTLKSGRRVVDQVELRMGFRQTEVRGAQLLINGQPVKIRGTCHHDSDPLLGRAVTAELERRDVSLIKEANLNSIRTSHYPPLPALLEAADELGVYMEDEGSFCWCYDNDDLRLTPRILQLESELLARDRNHPSVFIWSVANESSWGFGLQRAHEWIRQSDPTRPDGGSWSDNTVEFDIRHNPISMADLDTAERAAKPVLWDECWCIYQGIWGDFGELWVDPGQRDYYVEPLPAIYARMMAATNIAGTQIWAWSDDIFCAPNRGVEYGRRGTPWNFIESQYHFPGRGLVGDAPWGVVDGWRRTKPEFWIIKKMHSPVKIKEGPLALPSAGQPITLEVANEYDFSDLSELTVPWRLGAEKGVARVSAAPHTTGRLTISPATTPPAGETLALEFIDARGGKVDAYNLPLGAAQPARAPVSISASAPLRILPQHFLEGDLTRVVGRDFELAFAKSRGALRRGTAFGNSVLLELPRLHVLVSGRPTTPLPDAMTWRLEKFEVNADGSNVVVLEKGHYRQFTGSYRTVITPNGEVTVQAAFEYSGDDLLAREIGLVLSAPTECDRLQWQRQGEWSVYPADHIGRLLGATRAFATHGGQMPPSWPWAEDNTPLGCNDFRGIKRHLYWASLSYPNGAGLCVKSDGSQSARAMVGPDRIYLNINDWYGGSHVGAGEWTSNYGEGKLLKSGQTIESTVRFQIGRIQKAGVEP